MFFMPPPSSTPKQSRKEALIEKRLDILTKYLGFLYAGLDKEIPGPKAKIDNKDAIEAVQRIEDRFRYELESHPEHWKQRGLSEYPPFSLLSLNAKKTLLYEWRKARFDSLVEPQREV
jgi:hypothetical protein